MKRILLGLTVLLFLNQSLFAKTIKEVADIMGVPKSDAEKIMEATEVYVTRVETNFSNIASSDHRYDQKIGESGLIATTINLFSDGRDSIIEISSKNNSRIKERKIYNYLHGLAKMSNKNNNISVKLEFGKKFYAKNIYKKKDFIGIDVDVFQLFESCYDSGDGTRCYNDITKKTIVLNVKKFLGTYMFSVDSVRVKETMSVDNPRGRLEF